MLSALISSVFVIYLYRSLNAAAVPEPAGNEAAPVSVEAALADLNRRIDALELCAGAIAKGAGS